MQKNRHHGSTPLRGIDCISGSVFAERQRFGRAFPQLPALNATDDQLAAVARSMRARDRPKTDSSTVAAGFTFLGQFIDHDITLDTTSSLERQNDPAAIRNFRTPLLELDSVYGLGPEASPYLYDQEHEGRLLTGTDENKLDLPRNRQGRALIGDPRNDENGIISQLHLAFLRYHNAIVALVEEGKSGCASWYDDSFREAQRLARWHYQWIVVHEFLPLIVDGRVLEDVLENGPRFVRGGVEPFLPVEFSVAAYRYGHSQVRSTYDLNAERRNVGLFKPPADSLSSFEPIPRHDVIDFSLFFAIGRSRPQPAQRIDTLVTPELYQLPFLPDTDDQNSLPFRNLLRGRSFGLPSGEAVACAMGTEPLTDKQVGLDPRWKLDGTPLWFYILKEAELHPENRLGQVGGRLVAETLLGMLLGDPVSYLRSAPCWKPCLPGSRKESFTMGDLIQLAASS